MGGITQGEDGEIMSPAATPFRQSGRRRRRDVSWLYPECRRSLAALGSPAILGVTQMAALRASTTHRGLLKGMAYGRLHHTSQVVQRRALTVPTTLIPPEYCSETRHLGDNGDKTTCACE